VRVYIYIYIYIYIYTHSIYTHIYVYIINHIRLRSCSLSVCKIISFFTLLLYSLIMVTLELLKQVAAHHSCNISAKYKKPHEGV
jgi:hypothetical protein